MLDQLEQPKIADELKKLEHEPLLPIEKKLIIWSLAVGIGLLGILILLSRTLFQA